VEQNAQLVFLVVIVVQTETDEAMAMLKARRAA
jgi:hypothetical protein